MKNFRAEHFTVLCWIIVFILVIITFMLPGKNIPLEKSTPMLAAINTVVKDLPYTFRTYNPYNGDHIRPDYLPECTMVITVPAIVQGEAPASYGLELKVAEVVEGVYRISKG